MSLSQQQWQKHIDAWQQTQISQAQYCRSNELDQSQFSYWKNKIFRKTASRALSSQFAIAQIETTQTSSALSVTLPSGVLIEGIDEINAHIVITLCERLNACNRP